MQKMELNYGKQHVTMDFPQNHKITYLEPPYSGSVIQDIEEKVLNLLEKPDAGKSLSSIIDEKKLETDEPKVAIIVNDLSRSTPVKRMLPPVLKSLHKIGISVEEITIVIATGTHRILTGEEENYLLGKDITEKYKVLSHNCDSDDLVSLGRFSTGNEFFLNRTVFEADIRIAIGEILFHYFAGFAGGRKSLCPGVCGRSTIMNNHKMMTSPLARLGNIAGNPLHQELMESLSVFPLHFVVNAICNYKKEVAYIIGGDPVEAWHKGLDLFRELNTVSIDRQKNVVIASAGGFPKDINLYQAQKAFEMAGQAVADGGTLVIFAECPEIYGNTTFQQWAEEGLDADEVTDKFENGFELGAHKLYYLARMSKRIDLILFSGLSREITEGVFCNKPEDWDECLRKLEEKHGKDFDVLVIPQGGIILPEIKK